MFQNLRKGTPLYVLHKQDARLEIGEVTNVTQPQAMYNHGYQNGQYVPPKMCVDVQMNIEGNIINLQKLQAEANIADENGMIVTDNRDAILSEIDILSKNSQKVLDSVEYHTSIVEKCKLLVEELNPHIKKEAEQAKEINDLKQQVNGLSEDLGDIKTMLTRVLNKKSKED